MIDGEICPVCKSKDTEMDGSFHYTYDDPAKVVSGWSCNSCNAHYTVYYKPEKIVYQKYVNDEDGEGWEDDVEVML